MPKKKCQFCHRSSEGLYLNGICPHCHRKTSSADKFLEFLGVTFAFFAAVFLAVLMVALLAKGG